MSIRARVLNHINGLAGHHSKHSIASALGNVTAEQVHRALLVLAYQNHLVRRVSDGVFQRK